MSNDRVPIYDVTLRDGAQTEGIDFTSADKAVIARELDQLGIDYIEGGWPGANPTDNAFFADPPALHRARLTAFGMTRRPAAAVAEDAGLAKLLGANTRAITIVGKTWDFHVDVALGIAREENLAMIDESVRYLDTRVDEVLFDAEHFFDGYKSDPGFALACIERAYAAGARWIVLCDTNGGTLPKEIERIVGAVTEHVPGSHLGIHCHDDTGNAVANSLLAIEAGARQVQGSLNGLGERCGNANLVSIIPSLILKMGYTTGTTANDLTRLTHVSRLLDERLNRIPERNAAYVGESAFSHKGGLHVSAVEKDPRCYEHIVPDLVGNRRHIVVSDQAGRSNILARLREIGLDVSPRDPQVSGLVDLVKEREYDGYAYDGAEASFELLARRVLGEVPEYFRLDSFRVFDERRWNTQGELITLSEATVKVEVGDERTMAVAEGNGPVNALDAALRKVLIPHYPQLANLRLVDYKVRILTPNKGTGAVTRVMIESSDGHTEHWNTVGVSSNVIDASFNALNDSITYLLLRDGTEPRHAAAPAASAASA